MLSQLLFGLDAGLVEQGLVALEFSGNLGRELGGCRLGSRGAQILQMLLHLGQVHGLDGRVLQLLDYGAGVLAGTTSPNQLTPSSLSSS